MMRTVDVLYALPSIVLVIVLTAVFETSVRNWALRFLGFLGASANGLEETTRMLFLFVGLGSVSWLTMARVVRGQVLFLRKQTYVQASRLLGASHARILVRHILPNVSGVIVVHLMLTIPSVILYESFLSYLGLGVRPPEASLGSLMAEGVQQINALRVYWWLIAFPAGVLIVTLMALNYVGDGLRDALDPRADP